MFLRAKWQEFWSLDFLSPTVQQGIDLEAGHNHPSALPPSSSSISQRSGLATFDGLGFFFPQWDKAIDPAVLISDMKWIGEFRILLFELLDIFLSDWIN